MAKPPSRSPQKPAAPRVAVPVKRGVRAQPAFPKKNQPPAVAAFAARLPLALGRKFEHMRKFLTRQEGVSEDVYYYGPKSGWALRYLDGGRRPLCALLVNGDRSLGIVSLDARANAAIDWKGLSRVAQRARRSAHGSPSLLWLDIELDEGGVADLKEILKAKLSQPATG
jgi:hypothetical protein